jgi:hypothetical protein
MTYGAGDISGIVLFFLCFKSYFSDISHLSFMAMGLYFKNPMENKEYFALFV